MATLTTMRLPVIVLLLYIKLNTFCSAKEESDQVSAAGIEARRQESVATRKYAKDKLLMGINYQFGLQGHKIDPEEALSCYNQSAIKGNADAMFNIGACLEEGFGVKKDLTEAYAFYLLAKTYGRTSGIRERLSGLEGQLSAIEVETGIARSRELYYFFNPGEKAAEAKRQRDEIMRKEEQRIADAKAEAARKEAAAKEKAERLVAIRASAEQGEPEAQYKLGCLYERGEESNLPRDDHAAAAWFHKAALQGHPEAQYRLGICYISGKGTPKDILQAYAFLDIAGNSLQVARDLLSTTQSTMTDAELMIAPRRSRELQKQIDTNVSRKAGK